MKNFFCVLSLKKFLECAAILLVAGCFVFVPQFVSAAGDNYMPVVVIDAGHGGRDGGAVGASGVDESLLNLEYAKTLESLLKSYGYRVVMTRSDMNGLYSPLAQNKKQSEMQKRESIIKEANPDLVISVHMNSFSLSSVRGAQVFYADGSQGGKALADNIQDALHDNISHAKMTAKTGDFYVLNCTDAPGVLIECGFLSNPQEEQLLQEESYRNDFCYQVTCGVLKYFASAQSVTA